MAREGKYRFVLGFLGLSDSPGGLFSCPTAPPTSKEMHRKGVGGERGAAPLLGSQGDDRRVLNRYGLSCHRDATQQMSYPPQSHPQAPVG